MTLGDKIKQYRKINNMTQDQLAKKLNISTSILNSYETNTVVPTIKTCTSISKIFNITLAELLKEVKD